MAETSGFFRSVSGDRKYTTDWLAKWVSSFISTGVYDGDLAVTAGDGMAIALPAGKAWINGYYYRNDASVTLPIANADGVLHRKDTVVLRWDVNERTISVQIIKGAFASTPVAPAIVRSVEQYDLKIAEVSIPAGTTAITQSQITDTRLDASVCGIVTSLINQVDTTTFYNQIAADLAQFKTTQQADFAAWFESIKGILGEDEAGNLLNMINAVADDLAQHKADTSAHITTATHTRTGTVNNLDIPDGAKNLTFLATGTIADGDSWTVNSQPVTAVLQNGEALPGELFKSGCWVTGVYWDGAKLFFKSAANPLSSIFGDGSDGDVIIDGTVTLPVPVPHQSIVEMQYKSLTINAGATLKCVDCNAGLIVRVQGNCTMHGTIDQSGLAPKTNPQNTYPYPAQLVCGDGGSSGASAANYKKEVVTGSSGMLKRPYGGGYGAGGPGGWGINTGSESYLSGWKFSKGGSGGSTTDATVDVSNASLFKGGAAVGVGPIEGKSGIYGGGASGGAMQTSGWAPSGKGGDGAGISGLSGGFDTTDGIRCWGGCGGGAGNYGGGVILLFVGGNLIIDGTLSANGRSGGSSPLHSNSTSNYANDYTRGGGGGGGGGGAIYIVHRGTKSITGTMSANGGYGGSGANSGSAGGVGSITVIQRDK